MYVLPVIWYASGIVGKENMETADVNTMKFLVMHGNFFRNSNSQRPYTSQKGLGLVNEKITVERNSKHLEIYQQDSAKDEKV